LLMFYHPDVFIMRLNLNTNTELIVDVKHCINLLVNMSTNI